MRGDHFDEPTQQQRTPTRLAGDRGRHLRRRASVEERGERKREEKGQEEGRERERGERRREGDEEYG